jgi:hypothetical protein
MIEENKPTIAELQKRTEEVEAEKKRKKEERVDRRLKREKVKRQQVWERLIAPIILVVTILISLIVYLL